MTAQPLLPFDDSDDRAIADLIESGALFAVSHSGGKDSQAMLLKIRRLVPRRQILVIHAHLPEVEWPGTIEHIEDTIDGLPLITCQAVKTFFEMVDHRGMFPLAHTRQCTSDLKRGPIEREIRRYLKAHPEFNGLVVSCIGLRAEESPDRAKRASLQWSARNSKAGREWYDWLPIQDMLKPEVFASIAAAGQRPHWAYAAGMTRLSCCFCILASRSDLRTAARLRPDLYARYVAKEIELDHTLSMSGRPLTEIVEAAKKELAA